MYIHIHLMKCLPNLLGIDYDCIILIAGAVGNRLARNSLQVYDTNSHILSEVCRLIVSSNFNIYVVFIM